MLSRQLNYNFLEIAQHTNREAEIIGMSFLHFYYKRRVADNINDLVYKLNVNKGFGNKLSKYTLQTKKGLFSNFRLTQCLTALQYLDILTLNMSVKGKLAYLYCASISPPYSKDCYIPNELTVEGCSILITEGLAVETINGIILPKEKL